MKKKLTLVLVAVVLVAAIAIGGSLAYFTSTDTETNTFTVGNVKIDLVENFDPEKAVLLPGSQSVNKIEKEVWIENIGDNDAWVWYEWYIPAALDSNDGSTGTNNVLHVNSYGYTWDDYRTNPVYWPAGQTEPLPLEETWDHDPENELGLTSLGPEGFFEAVEIEGVKYHRYVVLYHGKLAKDEATTIAMNGAYLDSKVDCTTETVDSVTTYTWKIGDKIINYPLEDGVNLIVKAYGIQADGFADVYAAYKAYQAQTPPVTP